MYQFHGEHEAVINGRRVALYTRDQLDALSRPELRKRARNLEDALGSGFPAVPAHQEALINWILDRQAESTGKTAEDYGRPTSSWQRSSSPLQEPSITRRPPAPDSPQRFEEPRSQFQPATRGGYAAPRDPDPPARRSPPGQTAAAPRGGKGGGGYAASTHTYGAPRGMGPQEGFGVASRPPAGAPKSRAPPPAPSSPARALATQVVAGPGVTAEQAYLDKLLWDEKNTKDKLAVCYQRALDGATKMKPPQLRIMGRLVAQALSVTRDSFTDKNLDIFFGRFDFDGNGDLSCEEASRLFMRCMRTYRCQKFGNMVTTNVPWGSPVKNGYELIRELGAGGQGAMKLYKDSQGQFKCIKFYDKANANAGGIDELKEEFNLMKSLANPHVARTFETFQDNTFYYLVNEPYFGGDLTKLVKNATTQGVKPTEGWWRGIFLQALTGLAYLHKKCMMHCDIKEPNIMVAGKDYANPHIVLIDFGLASAFAGDPAGAGGTPGYMPPETLEMGTWFPKGDTWSMGTVMFQLLTGRVPQLEEPPFVEGIYMEGVLQHCDRGGDPFEWIRLCTKNNPPPWKLLPRTYHQVRDLLEKMLDKDRKSRWKVAQCLQHPWFDSNREGAPIAPEVITALNSLGERNAAQEAVMDRFVERLNLAECRELNDAFLAADRDRSGFLEAEEVRTMLDSIGMPPQDQEYALRALGNRNGRVSYRRFVKELLAQKALNDSQTIRQLFDDLDVDHSGFLDKVELRRLVASEHMHVDPEEIDSLLEEMDANHDGLVSFDEFRDVVIRSNAPGAGKVGRR